MFGEKVPAPPLQVAELAPPPMLPARVTVGELAQTVWFAPAFTVAAAFTVTDVVAEVVAPLLSVTVNVKVYVPEPVMVTVGLWLVEPGL